MGPPFEDLGRDLRFGVRALLRRPGLAATAILSLALGIAATTGIFSLVDQVLLRLLPVRDPGRLVALDWNGTSLSARWGGGNLLSYPLCRDLEEQERFFDGVLCRLSWGVVVSAGQGHDSVEAELVSGSYFDVLGVRPALGRLIAASDDLRPGEHPVVVLSHDYWQAHLGAPADIVGRRVLVNGHPMTVIGVAEDGFTGLDVGQPAAIWLPTMMVQAATFAWDRVLDRRAVWVHVVARLRAGITAEQAQTGLQPWFASTLEADTRRDGFPNVAPEARRNFLASSLTVTPAGRGLSPLRDALRRPLSLTMAGTAFLLVLACLNVANLLLARGAERRRELMTRLALGATRARLSRQLIVEGFLLAVAGGGLGLLAAPLVSQSLLFFLPPNAVVSPAIDLRIALFALAVTAITGVVCAAAPAVQAGRGSLAAAIQGRPAAGGGARVRKTIVVTQLALTLLLLVGAGLFVQTLLTLQGKDRGFDGAGLVLFRVDAAAIGYQEGDAARVMRDVHRRLQQVPGVAGVALANNSMLGGAGPTRSLVLPSVPRALAEGVPTMRVSPGFFATIGAALITGREFDEAEARDAAMTGIRSVIVNESFARRHFGGRNPVGERIGLGARPDMPLDVEIVGLVADVSRRELREDERPDHLFVPFAQTGPDAGDGVFYVRVRGDAESAFAPLQSAVSSVDPTLPVDDMRTFDEQVNRALQAERMLATLSSGFGAAALVLSLVGLYGVMSFVVTQRTQEIGVRMALGATRADAVWLVVRDALTMVAAGAAIAVPIAWAVRRAVEAQLYGIRGLDGPTIAAAGGGLAACALGAAMLPAWRAAIVSPMVAIRDQPQSLWQAARVTVRRVMDDLAAGTADADTPSVTMIDEFTGLVQSAESFPEALQVALRLLQDRVDARFIVLLEKAAGAYRGGDLEVPARGVLVNRLTAYRHPLPIAAGELDAWLEWASEARPEHREEIAQLLSAGVRMAVALRTRREIVGVLLLGEPRGRDRFSHADQQVLGSAAEVFALMIENARLNDRALEQEKVRRDLALAAEVQRRLLPPSPPSCAAATLAAFTLPARGVGGDFYDFVELAGQRTGIAVADIAGKGIAAALLTSVVQASLRVITGEGDIAPATLAARMNRFLQRSTASNGYATFFYAQLTADGRRLRYVNAGHNPPYLLRRTATGVDVRELSLGGTVLGLFPDVTYEDAEVDLLPGDLLVVFTDGLPEARNPQGEELGEEPIKDLLRHAAGAPAGDVAALLTAHVRDWIAGAEQHDDVTFVVASVTGTTAPAAEPARPAGHMVVPGVAT